MTFVSKVESLCQQAKEYLDSYSFKQRIRVQDLAKHASQYFDYSERIKILSLWLKDNPDYLLKQGIGIVAVKHYKQEADLQAKKFLIKSEVHKELLSKLQK